MEFGPCEERHCLSFPITNDRVLKEDKSYTLSLVESGAEGIFDSGIDSSIITVLDDDSKFDDTYPC